MKRRIEPERVRIRLGKMLFTGSSPPGQEPASVRIVYRPVDIYSTDEPTHVISLDELHVFKDVVRPDKPLFELKLLEDPCVS